MFNRSELCRQAIGERKILTVVEPLVGEDCHVIANTAWRKPADVEDTHGGGRWHIDAGPHLPRHPAIVWDDRIPLSEAVIDGLDAGRTRSLLGLHEPFFYDG